MSYISTIFSHPVWPEWIWVRLWDLARTYLKLPLNTAMGCRQCLPLSVVQLKGKHCRKLHCCNGVVDTFGQYLLCYKLNAIPFQLYFAQDAVMAKLYCWNYFIIHTPQLRKVSHYWLSQAILDAGICSLPNVVSQKYTAVFLLLAILEFLDYYKTMTSYSPAWSHRSKKTGAIRTLLGGIL